MYIKTLYTLYMYMLHLLHEVVHFMKSYPFQEMDTKISFYQMAIHFVKQNNVKQNKIYI